MAIYRVRYHVLDSTFHVQYKSHCFVLASDKNDAKKRAALPPNAVVYLVRKEA